MKIFTVIIFFFTLSVNIFAQDFLNTYSKNIQIRTLAGYGHLDTQEYLILGTDLNNIQILKEQFFIHSKIGIRPNFNNLYMGNVEVGWRKYLFPRVEMIVSGFGQLDRIATADAHYSAGGGTFHLLWDIDISNESSSPVNVTKSFFDQLKIGMSGKIYGSLLKEGHLNLSPNYWTKCMEFFNEGYRTTIMLQSKFAYDWSLIFEAGYDFNRLHYRCAETENTGNWIGNISLKYDFSDKFSLYLQSSRESFAQPIANPYLLWRNELRFILYL